MFALNKEKSHYEHLNLTLSEEDRKKAVTNLNRAIGQIKSVIKDLEEDHACEESLTQLQAARGSLGSQINKLIDKGLLSCLSEYPKEKISQILQKILRIQG